MSEKNILNKVPYFLEDIYKNLESDGIDVSDYELDHICYRVETNDRYDKVKTLLESIGEELTEFEIRERKISTYKLEKPLTFRNKSISCIELSSPREDMFFPESFEHVEFVIKEDFDDFMSKYPNVIFNTEAVNKKINPELIRQYKKIAVKFHHYSLEHTIKYLQ